MAPALKASSRPPASEVVAACAVRTLARDRDVHADEAGRAGEDSADRKADRDKEPEEVGEQREDDDADQADGGVLAPQIGLCALAHGGSDFLHPRITGIGGKNRRRRPDRVGDSKRSAEHDQP